jgi:predicted amidohydrolase YtcJ
MSKAIYHNGTILTAVDEAKEAAAVLTENGVIKAVAPAGAEETLLAAHPDAKKADLRGSTLVPGFIDGHSHFLHNALTLFQLDARPQPMGKADTLEQLLAQLKEQLADPKYAGQDYIYARGYDEAVYPDHKIPTRWDLDRVTTKPLALTHASGHNTVFNSAALAAAGIDDAYTPPPGSSVGRLADGTLTGIFHERAREDVLPKTLPNEKEILEKAWDEVVWQYVSKGVTTAQDAATNKSWHDNAREMANQGRLPLDLVSYAIGPEAAEILTAQDPQASKYANHYRVAGFKIFLDGSPQAKTAWLSKPYFIPPENTPSGYAGYGTHTDEEALAMFKTALEKRWQINVHTNGDEAIEQLIRLYQKAQEATGVTDGLRPVSIHCQTVREDQLARMKELGILASFFVDHVFYWGDYHAESVLGPERARRISPLASALKLGLPFSLHQDTPVTEQNPIFAIHNAVNRTTRSGQVLGEEYRISPWEALKAVTINAAYQLFEEQEKGSIEAGKRADFAVLSDNPLRVPPEQIKNIYVRETIKDGVAIYRHTDNI